MAMLAEGGNRHFETMETAGLSERITQSIAWLTLSLYLTRSPHLLDHTERSGNNDIRCIDCTVRSG